MAMIYSYVGKLDYGPDCLFSGSGSPKTGDVLASLVKNW